MRTKIRLRPVLQRGFLGLAVFTLLSGCISVPERNPVPRELILEVGIPGIPHARTWADEWPQFSEDIFANFTDADFRREFSAIYGKSADFVAISGGGANGAFGAGLFNGWTEAGTRPEFAVVTGVSTGALTAPFVFLGPEYDDVLNTVYTTTRTEDIANERNLLNGFFSDAMADTEPLQELIAKYITADIIAAIGVEHQKGRRLFVGTVNLDAGRSMIWNIGAIALSDYPDKLRFIHELMRASASIPIVFPPVVIPVEADGVTYDELHVDGGTGSQVFVYPAAVNMKIIKDKLKVQGTPRVYVLRNSFIDPDYQGVNRSVLPIASRTVDSLIRTQGIGDLYQIYALCVRDGNDFNLAYIPSSFTEEPAESFDPVYMSKLFELGYKMGRDGYPWEKLPPGFEAGQLNDDD
ncbi:MAG: patatin-like phospholipase family protein [Gammaproteobacteria bacterium]